MRTSVRDVAYVLENVPLMQYPERLKNLTTLIITNVLNAALA